MTEKRVYFWSGDRAKDGDKAVFSNWHAGEQFTMAGHRFHNSEQVRACREPYGARDSL